MRPSVSMDEESYGYCDLFTDWTVGLGYYDEKR